MYNGKHKIKILKIINEHTVNTYEDTVDYISWRSHKIISDPLKMFIL